MKKLSINRNIYSDRAIKESIKAYKNYALMSVKYNKEYAVVVFWKCKYDENQTIKEFENYMIGIENS